jgi:hypothetical protein
MYELNKTTTTAAAEERGKDPLYSGHGRHGRLVSWSIIIIIIMMMAAEWNGSDMEIHRSCTTQFWAKTRSNVQTRGVKGCGPRHRVGDLRPIPPLPMVMDSLIVWASGLVEIELVQVLILSVRGNNDNNKSSSNNNGLRSASSPQIPWRDEIRITVLVLVLLLLLLLLLFLLSARTDQQSNPHFQQPPAEPITTLGQLIPFPPVIPVIRVLVPSLIAGPR